MNSPIKITQISRPARLSIICHKEIDKILKCISYYSCLNGGIYNFIIPLDENDNMQEMYKKFLSPHLSDLIYFEDKRRNIDYREHPIELLNRENRLNFIDLIPFYQDILYDDPFKENYFYTESNIQNDIFYSFLFGFYDNNIFDLYKISWEEIVNTFSNRLESCTSLNDYKILLEKYLLKNRSLFGKIQITKLFLSQEGMIDPSSLILFLDHNNIDDLILFWNIRALEHRVILIPIEIFREINYANIDNIFRERIGRNTINSLNISFCHSIPEIKRNEILEFLKENNISWTLSTPFFEHTSYEKYPKSLNFYFKKENIIGFEQENKIIVHTSDPFNERNDDNYWINSFELNKNYYQQRDQISMFPQLSINAENILFNKTYNKYFISKKCISKFEKMSEIEISLPKLKLKDFLEAYAKAKDHSLTLSEPGSYLEEIFRLLDGYDGYDGYDGVMILKIDGVRKLIQLINNEKYNEKYITDFLTTNPFNSSTESNEKITDYVKLIINDYHNKCLLDNLTGFNSDKCQSIIKKDNNYSKDIYIAPKKDSSNPEFVIQKLVEKNVLQIGYDFECKNGHKHWYELNQISNFQTCIICGTKELISSPKKFQFSYKTKGIFRIKDLVKGSIVSGLAIWRLLKDYSYSIFSPSLEIKSSDDSNNFEVDLFLLLENCNSFRLIIGEAKSSSFSEKDFLQMDKAATFFEDLIPILCFFTLKSEISDQEKELFRKYREQWKNKNIDILLFTKDQIDKYSIEFNDRLNISKFSDYLFQINCPEN
jgi:hypothetical protein